MDFPGGLEGKESAYNAGDQGLIPGLGQEDPLEKEMAIHSNDLPGKFHRQKSLVATARGVTKSQIWLSTHTHTHHEG